VAAGKKKTAGFQQLLRRKIPRKEEEAVVVTSRYASVCRAPGCLKASVGSSMLHGHFLWAVTHLGQLGTYCQQGLRDSLPTCATPALCTALQGLAQSCPWQLYLRTEFLGGSSSPPDAGH